MKKLNLNTIVIKFKENFEDLKTSSNNKMMVSLILILGLTAFLVQFHSTTNENHSDTTQSIDTFIPKDQRLLTIEVMNYESLDQIIGNFAVVDIYTQPLVTGERARLIMPQARLMRSTKSPRHFNILLKPQEVSILASHSGEFIVSISNPNFIGTKVVIEKAKNRRVLIDEESI